MNIEPAVSIEYVLKKLQSAEPSSFHILESAKAKRMNAKTLYIPSLYDVANAIRAIPKGTTKTIIDLRNDLALMGQAETACPAKTIKYWKWLSLASEMPEITNANSALSIPWWRVLKDGKASRHMPGGIAEQISRLKAEGVILK